MTGTKISPNWRDDPGLFAVFSYKKKFALFPITCSDGTRIHFRRYYAKYAGWTTQHYSSDYMHTDFVENITEDEYLIRKLAETL